ncbi:hypothetical protein Scep_029787 [Stephania cephalantha]|uniref:Uncharacterized protein n=1 Tax=Stephania cephalantha TaxID=152367 RepID=A0AAP0DYJ9_9MAGN
MLVRLGQGGMKESKAEIDHKMLERDSCRLPSGSWCYTRTRRDKEIGTSGATLPSQNI